MEGVLLGSFKKTLKRLNRRGEKAHGEEWPRILRQRRDSLEEDYKGLSVDGRSPIDYSDLASQAMYVFAYAAPRAYFADEFLQRHREKIGKPLFGQDHLEIFSFGGGPASELVGLVNYLDEHVEEGVTSINYTVLDKGLEWKRIAKHVIESIESEIAINYSFVEVDFANKDRCAEVDISVADLLIFSYVSSELFSLEAKDEIQQNLNHIFAKLPGGARILFIESKVTKFVKFFKNCKGFNGKRLNDDDEGVDIDLPELRGIFAIFATITEKQPRSSSDAILSHWYVKS